MIQTGCLTPVQLQAYLQGTLPEAASDEIEVHLRSCSRCNDSATRLESHDDALIRHLRLPPDSLELPSEARPATDDPEWAACLQRLRQVPNRDGPSSNAAAATTLQERIEPNSVYHYQLDGVIGRGGMGVVYRGWHPQLHRAVAVKILSASRADDAASVARFQREMRAAGTLDHAAIVRALDAGVWHGTYYLVMELVDGIDLAKLVRLQGPLGAGDACALIVQAAEALDYAHEHQVIHRDIKPSNLMLARDGQLKILDFGLARLEHAGVASHAATSAGRLIGTLDYLAPEQAGGEQQVDKRADVYGLGATLFKLLAGEPPHGSSAQRPMLEHLQRITGQAAGRLDQFRHDLPAELVAAVSDMLQRDPDKRIASAADVADRLRRFATGDGLSALAQETLAKAERAAIDDSGEPAWNHPTGVAGPARAAKPAANSGRRRIGPLAAVVLILLATVLGAFAGVTIVLKTGEGELIVESEVDDITLELIPDGATAASLQVRAGKTTTIRSGRYELRVAGTSDSVTVDPREIVVRRGEQRIVSVRKKPGQAKPGPAVAANDTATWQDQLRQRQNELKARLASQTRQFGARHPEVMATDRELEIITQLVDGPVDAPTHKGRTYAQWRDIVLRETETITVLHAIDSLVKLSQPDQHDQTLATLFRVAEKIGRDFPTAFATRDAHIDLHNRWGNTEPGTSVRSYFQAGSASWQSIMRELVKALDTLPADAVARQLDASVEGHRESDQLLTIAYLASRAVAGEPLDGSASWIEKLAVKKDSDLVRAVAIYVQLSTLKASASRQHVDELKRNLPLVAPAVLIGMLDTNQYTAPDEMGRAAATSVLHAIGDPSYGQVRFLTSVLRRQSDHALGGPPPIEQETVFLQSFAKQLVLTWQDTNTSEFPGHGSLMMLAGLNLLDDESRRIADRQLAARLDRWFAERAALTSVAELSAKLGDADKKPTLLSLAITLLYVRGELPVELLNHPLDIESPLGREFASWRESRNPGREDNDGFTWMTWYPLEATEVYVRGSELCYAEFAIHLAVADVTDVELQTGLNRTLRDAAGNGNVGWISWQGFPKYREMLAKLARESVVVSVRVASLELAQRAGLGDEDCQQLALESLDADPSSTDNMSIVRTLSRVHSLEFTPETFDRLFEIVKRNQRVLRPEHGTDAYVNILRIMATSRVVTPQGMTLLRACLGSRERSLMLPRRMSGRPSVRPSAEEMILRIVAQSVPVELFRQALVTTGRLGPRAAEVLPTLEAALAVAEKTKTAVRVSDSELERKLRAVIKAVQSEPEPPADKSDG